MRSMVMLLPEHASGPAHTALLNEQHRRELTLSFVSQESRILCALASFGQLHQLLL